MQGQPQPSSAPPRSGAAIAALVCGILGVCFLPLGIAAIVLGVVALSQIGKRPGMPGQGMAIAGIVLGGLSVLLVGIYAAIAIPNFIRYQARAKQSECKANLKSLYTAEQMYFEEKNAYSDQLGEVGFDPEPGNRYAYVANLKGASKRGDKAATIVPADQAKHPDADSARWIQRLPPIAGGGAPGVAGTCPDCNFTAVCIGNLDKDDTLDVWSISSARRTAPDGSPISPGEPHNDVNDVTE